MQIPLGRLRKVIFAIENTQKSDKIYSIYFGWCQRVTFSSDKSGKQKTPPYSSVSNITKLKLGHFCFFFLFPPPLPFWKLSHNIRRVLVTPPLCQFDNATLVTLGSGSHQKKNYEIQAQVIFKVVGKNSSYNELDVANNTFFSFLMFP